MKFIFNLIIVAVLFSCATNTQPSGQKPIDFVPSSSILVLQSNNLANTAEALLENTFIKANKELPVMQELKERIGFFKSFKSKSNGVFCFSAVGKKDIATTWITSSKDVDFQEITSNVSKRKRFTYEGKEINEFTWKDKQLYAVWFDDILFVSDVKLIVENKIRDVSNQLPIDEDFLKILKTVDASYPSVYIKLDEFQKIYQKAFAASNYGLFGQLTDWVALDVKTAPEQLRFTGVSISNLQKNRKLSLLTGQKRIEQYTANLVPMNAIGFKSFSITDFETYNQQRKKHGLTEITKHLNLFQHIEAVGEIRLANESVVVLQSKDAPAMVEALQVFLKNKNSFRSYEIFQLEGLNLTEPYLPFIEKKPRGYVSQIGELFVLASSADAVEQIIISQESSLTLQNNLAYQTQIADLSAATNVLMYTLTENWLDAMKSEVQKNFESNIKNISIADYKGVVLQMNVDNEYAYVNVILNEVDKKDQGASVQQKNRFKIASQSLIQPQFFTNWRTKQRDVLVQDKGLVAELLDANGKTIWTKKMEDVIMGEFTEFDIYKNTRIQMAFATENKIHVLDKNGDEVAPFPIQLINPITQALAVFDYDNNGTYRFMVTQGKSLKAFDKGGNEVKGFSFTTSKSNISRPPKHYRIGKKDYILVQEESGQLHILDRRGAERVTYTTDLQFSGEPWFVYDGKFTSTTSDGDLVQISESGNVEITEKDLATSHRIVANQRLLVTFSENKLQINDVEIELEYGLYTAPQILQHQNKAWVSITDTQAKKLYVFDEFGNSVQGFPVFGTSSVDYFGTSSNTLQLLVEGEDQAILIYEIE